jgi:hypothetical protein
VQSSQVGLSSPHVIPYSETRAVADAETVAWVEVGLMHRLTPLGWFSEETEEYSSEGTALGSSSALTVVTVST